MTGSFEDEANEILNSLLSSDFNELPIAEQIVLAKALQHTLRVRIAESHQGPDSEAIRRSRRGCGPELSLLIGEVVSAAAWAEDAGGTLLQASSGDWDIRAKGYDDTSSSLVRALRKVAPPELVDRLHEAMKLRHFVVHGFFIDGGFMLSPLTGKPLEFISMKRSYRTDAPEREMKAFTSKALRWLADEFWDIEEELEQLHSEVLGMHS